MTIDRTISFTMRRIAGSWITEINYVPDCVVALYMGGATTFACKSQGCRWVGLVYFSVHFTDVKMKRWL